MLFVGYNVQQVFRVIWVMPSGVCQMLDEAAEIADRWRSKVSQLVYDV